MVHRTMRSRRTRASAGWFAALATTTTTTTAILASLFAPGVAASDQLGVTPYAHAARAALDNAAVSDPLAREDSYASLSETHKDVFRRHSATRTLREKADFIKAPIVRHATVEVRLVGFDGDGAEGVRLTERDFTPYLDALRADVPHVSLASSREDEDDDESDTAVRPDDDSKIRAGPITTRFHFHVTQAPRTLSAAIAAAIDDALEKADATRGSLVSNTVESSAVTSVPHQAIDSLIAKDHENAAAASHVLYVLNPLSKTKVKNTGGRAYAYTYDAAVSSPPGFERGTVGSCAGTLWTGTGAENRYAWFDLAAGPVTYGPRDGGEGAVFNLPRVHAAHVRKPGHLAVGIAGLLRRAANHLLAPPASHELTPVFWQETVVKIVRVTDLPKGNEGHAPPLGIREIEKALRAAAVFGGVDDASGVDGAIQAKPAVTVHEVEVGIGSCSLCVAAMHRALKATARSSDPGGGMNGGVEGVEGDTYAGAEDDGRGGRVLNLNVGRPAGGTHREFLDSKELRYWLSAFRSRIADEIELDLGDRVDGNEGNRVRVVPVFLFDLVRTEALLLDGSKSAVSFPDMALAVRTRAPSRLTRFQCGDLPVLTEPADVHRSLLGAILTTGWGVAPTHLTYSEARKGGVSDHAFDVGNSPFGDLSSVGRRGDVSFAASDAAKRHAVLAVVGGTRAKAAMVLAALSGAADGEDAMVESVRDEFNGRWASMSHKHERALAAEAMHDHVRARHFAMSADVDLAAATEMVARASENLESRLECFQEASGSSGLIWHVCGSFAVFVGVYFKGRDAARRWWNVKVAKQF